jgi:hypothetical protein
MNYRELSPGSVKAIPQLDAGDVEKAYCYSASRYDCKQ